MNVIAIHDPNNEDDKLPDWIIDLQSSPKHQVLVCTAKDEDNEEAWRSLVLHFGVRAGEVFRFFLPKLLACRESTASLHLGNRKDDS